MKGFLRQLVLLAVAGGVSWWVLLATPPAHVHPGGLATTSDLEITVMPAVHSSTQPPDPAAAAAEDARDPAPPPHPSERGTPEGEPEGTPSVSKERAEEEAGSPGAADLQPTDLAELMTDPELLGEARDELAGRGRQGFTTVLLAPPEDQLDIALFFGEEVVLVPRSALDPTAANPRYFRISDDGHARVESVRGKPPLESFRQYRDLFDYEYARLPASLRELRRSVLSRNEIYLFAALIPPPEWAVVIARRQAALERSGRDLSEVRRFLLRYLHLPEERFDVEVAEILFQDGSRHNPKSTE